MASHICTGPAVTLFLNLQGSATPFEPTARVSVSVPLRSAQNRRPPDVLRLCTLEPTDSMAEITERPPEVLPSHPSYQLGAVSVPLRSAQSRRPPDVLRPLHPTKRFRTFWNTASAIYERSRKLCVKETERYPSEYRSRNTNQYRKRYKQPSKHSSHLS